MRTCIVIIHHVFPEAPSPHDQDLWEIGLGTESGRVVPLFQQSHTVMYNFEPLTYAQQVEKEVRYLAASYAKQFGLTVRDFLP